MILLLQLISTLDIIPDHGYILKLAGKDEERYMTQVNTLIRMILAKDLLSIKDKQNVFQFIKKRSNTYEIKSCDSNVNASPTTKGVIASKTFDESLSLWKISENGKTLRLNNLKDNECLMQTDNYDTKLKGFRLNTRNCEKKLFQNFVLIDVGPMWRYCTDRVDGYCRSRGFEKSNQNVATSNANIKVNTANLNSQFNNGNGQNFGVKQRDNYQTSYSDSVWSNDEFNSIYEKRQSTNNYIGFAQNNCASSFNVRLVQGYIRAGLVRFFFH